MSAAIWCGRLTRSFDHIGAPSPTLRCESPALMRLRSARVRAAVFGGMAALAYVAGAASEALSPATFVSLSGSVVRVEASREGGGLHLGTGVTIAPSDVVTNCHVTRDAI